VADDGKIRELVEKAVADALAAGLPALRRHLVQQVIDEVLPALSSLAGGEDLGRLQAALTSIHAVNAQSDVLRALLDGAAAFCERVALFLLRGGAGVGWQGRGFRDNEAIKLVALELDQGLTARALQERQWVAGPVAEFSAHFIMGFGAPATGKCLVAPLVIREKVSGLIYADAGLQPGGRLGTPALDILIRVAGAWLEVLALRKSTLPAPPPAATVAVAAAPPRAAPPVSAPAAATVSSPAAEDTAAPPQAVAPAPEIGSHDEELHRKARRFAKLLVDEIKLYNQTKVAEGKLNHDLYDRLQNDIDKSRTTYDKRYGHTTVAGADYFNQELIRNLADDNPTLLGSNFPR
jgi:hypothetical protein